MHTYVVRYRWRWLAGILLTTSSTCFGLVMPWLLREAIDTFSSGAAHFGWPLGWYAGAMVVVAIFEGLSRSGARYILTGVSRWVEYELLERNGIYARLYELQYAV